MNARPEGLDKTLVIKRIDCGVHFRLNFDSLGEPNIFLVTCMSDFKSTKKQEVYFLLFISILYRIEDMYLLLQTLKKLLFGRVKKRRTYFCKYM